MAAFAAVLLVAACTWRIPIYGPSGHLYNVRVIFEIFFQFAVITLAAGFLWKRANKWWAIFLILTFVSSIFPFSTIYSTMTFRYVFLAALWFLLLVESVESESVEKILDALCIVVLFNVFFQCVQFLNMDPLYVARDGGRDVTVGLMSNVNETSALLAFCFPAFMRRKWRWFIPVPLLGLVLARSFGGVLALGFGLLFYAGARSLDDHKKMAWVLLVTLIGVVGFFFIVDKPSNLLTRLTAWNITWQLFKQHWLFGAGIGHWKVVFHQFSIYEYQWTTAHNEFIQALFEMGIGFVVILGGYIVNIVRRFTAKALLPVVALVIIAVNSAVNFPMHIATSALIAVTWMALLEIQLRSE